MTKAKSKKFCDTLDLTPAMDPHPRLVRGYRGRQTGLGICLWLFNCFQVNEHLPPKRKMTNAAIQREFLREFGHKPGLQESLEDSSHPTTINLYRHKYNQGCLLKDTSPEVLSVRYNLAGDPVDSRTGSKVLTKRDYLILLAKYDLDESKINKQLFQRLKDG